MNAHRSSASLISRATAFIVPLILAAYWPLIGEGGTGHTGVLVIRFLLLGSVVVLWLLWAGEKTTQTELRWVCILAGYLAILLLASALSEHFANGVRNWLRAVVMYCIAIGLARPLRHRSSARAFGMAMGIAGLGSILFILAVYVHYSGLAIKDYKEIREFKTLVQAASGIALNPLASATVLFCALHLCLSASGWMQRLLTVVIAVLASFLTGSRAPLGMAFAGFVALCIGGWLRGRSIIQRAVACAILFGCFAAIMLGFSLVNPVALSKVTEGRYDLWTVGMVKFAERPWAGYGAESWSDDLAARLPGYYPGSKQAVEVSAGGYHSEFVTLLAEGGLLCFIPAVLIFWILFRTCWRIAYHPSIPKFQGQAILFTFYLIFFRACVEIPGIFGYGEDVTDYLAAMFIAIVISQASLLDKPRAGSVTAARAVRSGSAFSVARAEAIAAPESQTENAEMFLR